jgi:1-phosphofructokinase
MIYTVTLNPSLDYFVTVENFVLGKTNRTASEQMIPGGKGLNVSMVLKNLGMESTALGFVAGFVGREIVSSMNTMDIESKWIMLEEGNSRVNVKIKNIEGTEINGKGPEVPEAKLEQMMDIVKAMKAGDYLVLAGSIPSSMPDSIYKDMMASVVDKGVEVIVDATGELLMQVLAYKPFLIKPNNHELGALFGVTIEERSEVLPYAQKLQEAGARNVLVSMAGKGAVLLAEDGQVFEMDAPKGALVNAVGAGDSMVAGFLTGWLESKDYKKAFEMGVCSGSASAFSEEFATREEVEVLLNKLG